MSHVTYYDGIAKGYDRLHKQEQQRKLKVILPHLQIKPTDMFVDVGCGTGVAFPFFNKMLAMCGVDPAIELLKIGQPVQKQSNMANARGEALPFRDSLFNIVLCLTAFHNFDDYPKGIEQMKRISTDDATIIITILKKISMAEKLGKMIHDEFDVVKELDDLHDNIYICNKKKAQ